MKFFPGYIFERVGCRKLILGSDIGWGSKGATSWCDLDFDLAVVTLTSKIFSRQYV